MEHVMEEILRGVASGRFHPGDRLVESELAEELNVSRLPVREALRVLEMQGVAASRRYKGTHLIDVTQRRLDEVLRVRVVLEKLAMHEARRQLDSDGASLEGPREALRAMRRAVEEGDAYGYATADTSFHRAFYSMADNEVLLRQWENLSPQLILFFSLATSNAPLADLLAQHEQYLEHFLVAEGADLDQLVENHIFVQNYTLRVPRQ